MSSHADPIALVDAAFAAGADSVSFHRFARSGPQAFAAFVSASKEIDDGNGRHQSLRASATGYGATWQDALVDAMLRVATAELGEGIGKVNVRRKAIASSSSKPLHWRERKRLGIR